VGRRQRGDCFAKTARSDIFVARDCALVQINQDYAPFGGYSFAVKERRLAGTLRGGGGGNGGEFPRNARDCALVQINQDYAPYGGYGFAVKERRLAGTLRGGEAATGGRLLRKNRSQ